MEATALLVSERVQTNAAGQVVLKLKTPWRDGTTHLVMSPLEFMQRLAALVPRPRLHLIRFHGVLAPNAKLRALMVPQQPEAPAPPAQAAKPVEFEANCAHHCPVRFPPRQNSCRLHRTTSNGRIGGRCRSLSAPISIWPRPAASVNAVRPMETPARTGSRNALAWSGRPRIW